MTTLPDLRGEDVRLVLLVDLGRRLEQAAEDVEPGSSWGRAGRGRGRPASPTPFSRWHETQLATSKICLPLANDRPRMQTFDRRGEVVEGPLLARAVVLEQVVEDRQRVGGQVARRIGEVSGDVLDDVERAVHPPPVAGIGADIRIDARLGRGGEARASASRAGRAAGWRPGSCRTGARSSARGPRAACSMTRRAGRPPRARRAWSRRSCAA